MNEAKNMQDKTPADVVCSKCAQIIVPAHRIDSFRQRDIDEAVKRHICTSSMESKRDFENEVR